MATATKVAADVRATCGTTTATSGPDDSTIIFDGRHDNGNGRYTTATGGTTTRHDSGKGQQGDRMHDNFDGRHDDDKGQQGNRWRDNQQRRDDEGHGGATKKAEPVVQR